MKYINQAVEYNKVFPALTCHKYFLRIFTLNFLNLSFLFILHFLVVAGIYFYYVNANGTYIYFCIFNSTSYA